jgi:SAM-dependent methyltransferase
MPTEADLIEREAQLRAWFTRDCDPIQAVVDGLDIGWGGVQRWATARMPPPLSGLHLDVACGYATFLAQVGWRFPTACLVGLNLDFEGPHRLARPLLAQARVRAALVQADARRMPFFDGVFASASCFLGLQDIEIGFGWEGVRQAVAESVRVLQPGGVLTLLDEFPIERFQGLLEGSSLEIVARGVRSVDVRWERPVAERAVDLYADGWAAQARHAGPSVPAETRRWVHTGMLQAMERQLAARGTYVPFGPVRLLAGRKRRK